MLRGAEARPSRLPPRNKCLKSSPLTSSRGPFRKHTLRLDENPIRSRGQDRGPVWGRRPLPGRSCGPHGIAGVASRVPPGSAASLWSSALDPPPTPRVTPSPAHTCSGPSGHNNLQSLIHFRRKNPGGGGKGSRDAFQGSQKASFLTSRCANAQRAESKHTRGLAATEQPVPHSRPHVHPYLSWGEGYGDPWAGRCVTRSR